MRKVFFVTAFAMLLAGCTQNSAATQERDGMVEIFDGNLIMLNGQPTLGSNISISLVAAGNDKNVANHYFLSGGCRDRGFLDKADGRFWSGSTPEKNGEMADATRAKDRSTHCLTEDVTRYHQIIAMMEEGATLEFGPDRSSAKFTTPSNKMIEFEYRPSMMID